MGELNRNAVILYLSSVIDLEVAKIMLANRYNKEMDNAESKLNKLKRNTSITMSKEYYDPGEKPEFETSKGYGYLTLMSLFVAGGVSLIIAPWFALGPSERYMSPYLALMGLILLGFFFTMLKGIWDEWVLHKARVKEWKRKSSRAYQTQYHDRIVRENAKALQRKQLAVKELKDYEAEVQRREYYLKNEWKKLNSTLDAFYSMNLIPGPYRHKLWAIYWLHEWMSTTPDSLSAAYASLQREDIARRMEARLDRLISMTEENIRQNRVLESLVSSSVEQNKAMISSLQNTERNTSIAAQYAQLSSNYSKASAYFSLANYLRG